MSAQNILPGMTLGQLLQGLVEVPPAMQQIVASGLSADSRQLQSGDVFLACKGGTSHGITFIEQAIAAGVAAVVWDSATAGDIVPHPGSVPMIPFAGLADHVATIANRWYDTPSASVRVAGVTGTNGKTTIAYLIAKSLLLLDKKCGYIGTLGSGIEEITVAGGLTTPACIELHGLLADFRSHGARFAAVEVSSHALQQQRVAGVRFDAVIFTNLSRDHIDYHGDMQAYGDIKASLFHDYNAKTRIVCIDSEFGAKLARQCGPNVVSVSSRPGAVAESECYVSVQRVVADAHGSRISLTSSWGAADINLQMPGDFNVTNAVEVLALLLSWDVPLAQACAVLSEVSAPPGRMQLVRAEQAGQAPAVYVDYSHTPASLEVALQALRAHCKGELWCVFGCGGDRDRGKRPLMGGIALQLADHAIVTSDNPRTEPAQQIISDITQGMSGDVVIIEDRRAAIEHAVHTAGNDDIVLIAGKGHENYQIIGAQVSPFSDAEVAAECLSARANSGTVQT